MLDKFPLKFSENVVTGAYVLKSLQDLETPQFDLLIRESIQNSLDAALEKNDSINVEYNIKEIQTKNIEDILGFNFNSFPETSKILEIRDYGTEGLNGPESTSTIRSAKDYGNYLKLVVSLGQNQTKEGAGGSWGLGKTIYYRLGKGLVFYYSRINTEESRLAACWIENEREEKESSDEEKRNKKDKGILKSIEVHTGVCWWGKVKDNSHYPEKDEEKIKTILHKLGIEPYDKSETGTTIIIPFISDDIENNNSTDVVKDKILKWYNLRMGYNWDKTRQITKAGARLVVKVNGSFVGFKNEVVFKALSFLHLFALTGNTSFIEQYNISNHIKLPLVEKWKREKVTFNNKTIGWISYVDIAGHELMLSNGNRKPQESLLGEINSDNDNNENDGNNTSNPCTIIAYTRKPGLIVNYENYSKYKPQEGEWCLGIFVVKSDDTEIEEYFRSCERATHTKWEHPQMEKRGNYLNSIVRTLNRIFEYKKEQNTEIKTYESAINIGKLMADIFMPPDGFGKNYNISNETISNTEKNDIRVRTRRPQRPELKVSEITYGSENICIATIEASIPAKQNMTTEICAIEGKKSITREMWKRDFDNEGYPFLENYPFSITDADLKFKNKNGEDISKYFNINKNSSKIEIIRNASKEEDAIVSGTIEFNMHYKDLSFTFEIK